ncbi:GlxA family transcriptional regulator [Propionibacteriaceae bacterium Y2011]
MKSRLRRELLVVVTDHVVLLDLAGPVQAFAWAGHRVRLASVTGRAVRSDVGIRLDVDTALADVHGRVDVLLVPGVRPPASVPPAVVAQVERIHRRSRRTMSVCTGSYLLAEAGILDGRRITTHWAACEDMSRRYPALRVEPDAIFVRDGPVITSAGVTAGIDAALALIEEDSGVDVARSIAKHLVMFMQRPGGQSQFSIRSTVGPTADSNAVLRRVLDEVVAAPADDHSARALAARANLSERHLRRMLRRESDLTPAQYVEQVRVEAAQALLESGSSDLAAVARHSGFGSDDSLRRAFNRVLGTTPGEYRRRFRSTVGTTADPAPSVRPSRRGH